MLCLTEHLFIFSKEPSNKKQLQTTKQLISLPGLLSRSALPCYNIATVTEAVANVSVDDLPSCSGEYPMWKSAKINTGTLAVLIYCSYHFDRADH